MRIKEFTGKTTQEAIDNGLAELGVTIADVHVDVLQEGAKGLFGLFGSKPACVRLTVMDDEREDDHGLSDLLGSFSLSDQKKKSAAKPAAPKPAPAKPAAPKAEAPAGPIGIEDFAKVKLIAAKIIACEKVEKSDKLLKSTLDCGNGETRTVVSGIAKWYKPEDLIGKKIAIVANLAPRPMMKGKYTSEGMIVAADTADGGCEIAFYSDNVPTGTRVH